MRKKKVFLKTAVLVILSIFLMTSAAQAFVITNNNKTTENKLNVIIDFDDQVYEWRDDFNNGQRIDMNYSQSYILDDGKVKMYGTYPWWENPSWTRAKIVTLDSDISGSDIAIKVLVDYDGDMRSDYGDVRFQQNNYFLEYWIEEKNPEPNDPYAIFWLKVPTLPSGTSYLYMFYGNPGATDQSDYWAVFDENSWNKEHAHDHRITNHAQNEGAWDVDVCWGNDKFLVTWEEGTPFMIWPPTLFKQQIRGCYYDTDGNPISNRFDIVDEPDETPPYRYENPSGAYGKDGKFFVAYEKYTNPIDNNHKNRDIEGAIVQQAEDGASNRFTICDANSIQADPCVTWDPNHERFFVVWEDAQSGGTSNYDIYGRFYTSSGSPIGSAFSICSEPNSQVEPWITYDHVNDHYIIVWEMSTDQPNTGPFEIWGQMFDWQGNPLGSAKQISQDSSSSNDYNFPCVAFCELTENFLVTWNQDDISAGDWNGDVYGRFVDENGNLGSIITIATGQFCRTDVVPYLSSSFFVAYDNWEGDGSPSGDIWGKMVNADGTVNDYTLQLSDNDQDAADWVNIGSSGNKIMVAWEDIRVDYPYPYDNLPDIYSNVWSLNMPSGSEVSYSYSEEKSQVLEAWVTSKPITPENWVEWYEFDADKNGDVDFDVLDADTLEVIQSDISPGYNIEGISKSSIRLKASFHRNTPADSPELDYWSVTYYGRDEVPPETNVRDVEGRKGLNDYYISESVKIYLDAQDYPTDTGSGVKQTYYRVKPFGGQWGSAQEYNEFIQLTASSDSKYGHWDVNFWSVDYAGNVEDRNQDKNLREIKIDWGIPYVTITSPTNEQEFEDTGFWVKAYAEDNVEIEYVEFDASPYGERPGLPYLDESPPYEWWCDVEKMGNDNDIKDQPLPNDGTNLYLRAFVYDPSGQSYYSEIVVYIESWDKSKHKQWNPINNRPLFKALKISFNLGESIDIEHTIDSNAEKVKFVATRIITKRQFITWDNDLSDGCTASFNLPTGFYNIKSYDYQDEKILSETLIARLIHLNI